MVKYTEEELRNACDYVIPTTTAFGNLPLPELCKHAAIEAFMHEYEGGQVDTIRRALNDLRTSGCFSFKKGNDGQEEGNPVSSRST
jgi:hypothetical protein